MINKPLFPTPGAPITASFTSERVDFFLRTWNRNIFATPSYIWQGLGLHQTIFWSKFLSSCFLDIKLCGLLLSCPTIRFILDDNKFKSLFCLFSISIDTRWIRIYLPDPANAAARAHLYVFLYLVEFIFVLNLFSTTWSHFIHSSPIVFVTLLHGSF